MVNKFIIRSFINVTTIEPNYLNIWQTNSSNVLIRFQINGINIFRCIQNHVDTILVNKVFRQECINSTLVQTYIPHMGKRILTKHG